MLALAVMVAFVWRGFPSPALPHEIKRAPAPTAEYLPSPPRATFSMMRTEEFSRRSGFGLVGVPEKIPNDIFAPVPATPPPQRTSFSKPRPEAISPNLGNGYSSEATSPVIPRLRPAPTGETAPKKFRIFVSASLEKAGFAFSLDGISPSIPIPRTRFHVETDPDGKVAHVLLDKPPPSPALAREIREIRSALERGRAATNASGYVDVSL